DPEPQPVGRRREEERRDVRAARCLDGQVRERRIVQYARDSRLDEALHPPTTSWSSGPCGWSPSSWMFTTPLTFVSTAQRVWASTRKASAAGRPGSANRTRGASWGSSASNCDTLARSYSTSAASTR